MTKDDILPIRQEWERNQINASMAIDDGAISRRPQPLDLPLLDLPQAIGGVFDEIHGIQRAVGVRRVLGREHLVRPDMVRDGVGGHRGGLWMIVVLEHDAHVADDVRRDQREDAADPRLHRRPPLHDLLVEHDARVFVLDECRLEEAPLVSVEA